ncbi:unnamed protein product [Brassica oleracea]
MGSEAIIGLLDTDGQSQRYSTIKALDQYLSVGEENVNQEKTLMPRFIATTSLYELSILSKGKLQMCVFRWENALCRVIKISK